MNKDITRNIDVNMEDYSNSSIIDTIGGESIEIAVVAKNTTKIYLKAGDESDMSDGESVDGEDYIIGDGTGELTNGTTTAGTSGTIVDTTSYPVTAQAAKTEKITVDSGTEQTVTFTTAINFGRITDTTTYPVTDQDGLTSVITVDGGDAQTVTFDGETVTAASVVEQMNEQLVGATASVVGGQVQITSDSTGATSAVAAAAGTGGLTWGAAVTLNTATSIASQINAQTYGLLATVNDSGQVLLTSNTFGTASTIAIGTGTCDLTWDTAAAGTGSTGAYVLYDGADTARIGYVGDKRYLQANIVNPATDTTISVIKGHLRKSPAN